MNNDSVFWDKLAKIYNKMFENKEAYQRMYSLMRDALTKDMDVLDVGTASGMVPRAIADTVNAVYAIDFSADMITNAREITQTPNISYSVQNSYDMEFEDESFDAVILSNVLHIMDKPEAALREIKRVLKDDGLFIAPTFMWKEKNIVGAIQQFFMMRKKFPIYSWWNTKEYINYLHENGFDCIKTETIPWNFAICYAECKKITG